MCGTIYSLRARVEVDETSLRWRNWRGTWRAAKWEEVLDFHQTTSKNSSTYYVETQHGNFIFKIDGDGKAIAQLVVERAINAQVREWGIKGERPTDPWPRRFEFSPTGLRFPVNTTFLILMAFCGWVAWQFTLLPPRADSPVGVYFMAYVGPLLTLPIFPFLIWLFFFVAARQARRFRGQSVSVSPSGLVFDGSEHIEATWAQIGSYHWIRKRRIQFLQVQTHTNLIEIPAFYNDYGALCRIIERFSGVPLVKLQSEEEMSLRPVETAPDGTLIFSCYVFSVRLLTWVLAPIGLISCLTPFLMHLADPQQSARDFTPLFIIGVLMIAGGLGLHAWLRNAQLRLTPDFLEWRIPLMPRQIAWKDIESYGSSSGKLDWIEVGSKKISLSVALAPIAQRSRLREEIGKRAFNAKGEWQ